MSELIDNGNINAAKNVHEKAAETFSDFEETSYELTSQLDEDQHEEYIIDDMKIKLRITFRKKTQLQISTHRTTTRRQ